MKNKCQKIEKIRTFVKKMLKLGMLKRWNHSNTTRNYAVTYYETQEKVSWHLGLNELKWQKFSVSLKKMSIKLRVF